jgi:phosphopantetheine adenylyltransferase
MTDWTAKVERLDHFDPARDALIVKVERNLTAQDAADIKSRIRAHMPQIEVLIFGKGYEVVIVKKRRAKTLVRAMRKARR